MHITAMACPRVKMPSPRSSLSKLEVRPARYAGLQDAQGLAATHLVIHLWKQAVQHGNNVGYDSMRLLGLLLLCSAARAGRVAVALGRPADRPAAGRCTASGTPGVPAGHMRSMCLVRGRLWR